MLSLRRLSKSAAVLVLGRECKPRRILFGLPSGFRINVSPAEHLGYLLGTTEPHLQRVIKRYVAAGDTVYDIGANIGFVSLSLSKQVGAKGRVVAFEPVPQNLIRLRENIQLNNIANIQVFESAASDRSGEAVIRVSEDLAMASMVWHKHDRGAAELTIQTVAVDDLVDGGQIPPPCFVKIDVEGAEGLALLGMRRTIASTRPVLFIECSDAGRETTWQLLKPLGYSCQSAISGSSITTFDNYRHGDFLWLPADSLVKNQT